MGKSCSSGNAHNQQRNTYPRSVVTRRKRLKASKVDEDVQGKVAQMQNIVKCFCRPEVKDRELAIIAPMKQPCVLRDVNWCQDSWMLLEYWPLETLGLGDLHGATNSVAHDIDHLLVKAVIIIACKAVQMPSIQHGEWHSFTQGTIVRRIR